MKQELGLAEYEAEAEPSQHALGLARAFAEFADPVGLVLDIGCGTAARPPYQRRDGRARYVGVDPLVGTSARDFEFVVGVGEQLPFRSGCFASSSRRRPSITSSTRQRACARSVESFVQVGVSRSGWALSTPRLCAASSYPNTRCRGPPACAAGLRPVISAASGALDYGTSSSIPRVVRPQSCVSGGMSARRSTPSTPSARPTTSASSRSFTSCVCSSSFRLRRPRHAITGRRGPRSFVLRARGAPTTRAPRPL